MSVFKITILGAGTMVPTKDRNPAGFLVEVGGEKILMDCGFGTIRRMNDLGYKLEDLDLVFVSHFHTDHFADAFTKEGVAAFWPWKKRSSWHLKTGSGVDASLFLVFIVADIVLFLWVAKVIF